MGKVLQKLSACSSARHKGRWLNEVSRMAGLVKGWRVWVKEWANSEIDNWSESSGEMAVRVLGKEWRQQAGREMGLGDQMCMDEGKVRRCLREARKHDYGAEYMEEESGGTAQKEHTSEHVVEVAASEGSRTTAATAMATATTATTTVGRNDQRTTRTARFMGSIFE